MIHWPNGMFVNLCLYLFKNYPLDGVERRLHLMQKPTLFIGGVFACTTVSVDQVSDKMREQVA